MTATTIDNEIYNWLVSLQGSDSEGKTRQDIAEHFPGITTRKVNSAVDRLVRTARIRGELACYEVIYYPNPTD